jgi:acetyltransferase-like isoleucine patch superfamily enzyme
MINLYFRSYLKKYLKKKYFFRFILAEYAKWTVSIEWLLLNRIISSFPSHTIRKCFLYFKGAKISAHAIIYGGCEFRFPQGLIIGSGSSIGHRAVLDARRGLTIGKNVVLSTDVMIWTLHHDYNDINFVEIGAPVQIGDYAWLGSRSIILPGITIGEGAVIAAGSVVTKNVEPYCVVGGIPAKFISHREKKNYNYDPANFRMHMV